MTEGVAKDLFGAELEAQGKALDERQRQLDADREKWRALVLTYVEFMSDRGQPVPAFTLNIDKPAPNPGKPQNPDTNMYRVIRVSNPRLGAKRKQVLEYIAKATREGRKVTSREVILNTDLSEALVANVMHQDFHNGYLDRVNQIESTGPAKAYEVVMTQAGFDFLDKIASNAPKKWREPQVRRKTMAPGREP